MIFRPSKPLTIGVELEFQLLHPQSLALIPAAPSVLVLVADSQKERIKEEFIQSMVEVNTKVCENVQMVQEELADVCRSLETIAEKAGCLLHASSLHPFSPPQEQHLTQGERYRQLMEELQEVGRRLMTQGLHIHIGVPDGPTAIKVFDQIRAYLPIFLVLTTSSPFFEARDTGLHSYRTKLFGALPRTGIPEAFGSWGNYCQLVESFKEAGVIRQIRDIWWDVRPHPDFGTIEIRICDLPCRLDEIVAMGAMVQATVKAIMRDTLRGLMSREMILSNKWQAVRYGLQGYYVAPSGLRLNLSEAVEELLEVLEPVARELGSFDFLSPIKRILSIGASSDRQRALYYESRDFCQMIKEIRKEFWK